MINKLQQLEDKIIPGLLQDPNNWKSLMIDYHPPIVERLWAQVGNYRVLLHWIHKCEAKDALFHPHPWPSAMHVISGKYEMGLGYGSGLEEPPKMCTILMENGGSYYDMTHVDGWHYVRPVDGICVTTMLIGPKWEREEIKSTEPLKPMPNERKMVMLEFFRTYYLNRSGGKKAETLKKLQRGDWVVIDGKLFTNQERNEIGKYSGQMAFVIKKEDNFAHLRLKEGNDRIISHIKNLSLLDPNKKVDTKEKPLNAISEDLDEEDFDGDLDEKNI